MKLKLYFTVFLIIFQIYSSFGKDFAPIGAKWYYTEQFAFSTDISYIWIESVGDTIIKGKNCKILKNNGEFTCKFHNTENFVYFEDSIVYFFVPAIDTFQILYDLKAQKDSSWTIVFGIDWLSKLDTIQVIVDSVSYVTINSKELKQLHVSYKSLNFGWEHLGYKSEIIEKIGDKNYLFNLSSLSGIFCDDNYSGGLRCYQDPDFGFYSTGIAESCDYTYKWTGIKGNSLNSDIKVYPNPASDWIEIESRTNKELMINILDLSGKVLVNYKFIGSSKFDLTSFQKGFYILRIIQSDNLIETRKIIKN